MTIYTFHNLKTTSLVNVFKLLSVVVSVYNLRMISGYHFYRKCSNKIVSFPTRFTSLPQQDYRQYAGFLILSPCKEKILLVEKRWTTAFSQIFFYLVKEDHNFNKIRKVIKNISSSEKTLFVTHKSTQILNLVPDEWKRIDKEPVQIDPIRYTQVVELVRKIDIPQGKTKLDVIKGMQEKGESPLQAACRELTEETNLTSSLIVPSPIHKPQTKSSRWMTLKSHENGQIFIKDHRCREQFHLWLAIVPPDTDLPTDSKSSREIKNVSYHSLQSIDNSRMRYILRQLLPQIPNMIS